MSPCGDMRLQSSFAWRAKARLRASALLKSSPAVLSATCQPDVGEIRFEVGRGGLAAGWLWFPARLAAAEYGVPLEVALVAVELALAFRPDGEHRGDREISLG